MDRIRLIELIESQTARLSAEPNRPRDKGPEAWKPPNRDYWCEYARRWIWIKSDWHLTVNPAEKSSLREML